jgi:hypothetical protein
MSKLSTEITAADIVSGDFAPLVGVSEAKPKEFFGQLVYLASPYTHKDKSKWTERFHAAVDCMGWLMNNIKNGQYFYSPIAHTHPIAERCTLPIEWEFWAHFDECILSRCSEMWILTIPGFTISTGVKAEREICKKFGVPVRFVIPQADGTYAVTDTEPEDVPV